jgi:hypothetical protein
MIHSTSNSHSLPGGVPPVGGKSAGRPAPVAETRDTLDTTASTALREALAALPEVRPEVVAKGRELAFDANYPPRAIIEDIARLFVQSRDLSSQD